MSFIDRRFCRVNTASAIALVLMACVCGSKAAASVKFDKARRDANTSRHGLFDGHMFERMAGSAEEAERGDRNGGPPTYYQYAMNVQ